MQIFSWNHRNTATKGGKATLCEIFNFYHLSPTHLPILWIFFLQKAWGGRKVMKYCKRNISRPDRIVRSIKFHNYVFGKTCYLILWLKYISSISYKKIMWMGNSKREVKVKMSIVMLVWHVVFSLAVLQSSCIYHCPPGINDTANGRKQLWIISASDMGSFILITFFKSHPLP